MNNKIWIGMLAIFVIGAASLVAVFAYQGNMAVKGPNYSEDVHTQLKNAIEAGDYNAWIQIREENNLPMHGRMFQVINEDNFDKFRELHNAMESGDTAAADAIRAELGLGMCAQKGSGMRQEGSTRANCPRHSN